MTHTTSSQNQKVESPKLNLRIRIPAPRPDEEILRSPINTPSAPMPAGLVEIKGWLRQRWVRLKI